MKLIKKISAIVLAICISLTVFGLSVAAAELPKYPVEIHIMTVEERSVYGGQAEDVSIVSSAYLSRNNEDGTNGSICTSFTAKNTGTAFVVTSAPGAANYNVQLYSGIPGEGERVSNYATVNVNNGVYFTNLIPGQVYYLKLSSTSLVTNSCTAVYSMLTF